MVSGPPADTPEATPAGLIVAIAMFDEVQFTAIGPDEPSEKWPVAVKVCVALTAIDAVGGATVTEVSVGGAAVTVS